MLSKLSIKFKLKFKKNVYCGKKCKSFTILTISKCAVQSCYHLKHLLNVQLSRVTILTISERTV